MHLEQWSKTKYYIVIFDQLQGHSGELMQAPESHVRGPLTFTPPPGLLCLKAIVLDLKRVSKSIWQMCLGATGYF